LTVHCGFRRGEILGLRWQDIDFKEGVLKVRNTRTRVATNVEKRPKSESVNAAALCPAVDVVNCPYIDGIGVHM
jgi:integrase